MAIYLDSASPDDARRAAEFGCVVGVTTNPKLLARAGKSVEELIPSLCDVMGQGIVFYQLTAATREERVEEAYRVTDLRPGCVGLKIPCTTENLKILPRLASSGLTCAVTAVFSAYQAFLACQLGADYLLPYVNRATRQLGDGIALVERIAKVIEVTEAPTELLAASFRTAGEVVEAVLVGADHVTISLELLESLGDHPLSDHAIVGFAQFTEHGTGLDAGS